MACLLLLRQKNPRQAVLISAMLKENSQDRPGALEILESELLPLQDNEDLNREVVKMIPFHGSRLVKQLSNIIFDYYLQHLEVQEYESEIITKEEPSLSRTNSTFWTSYPNLIQSERRRSIINTFEAIFEKHGALPSFSSSILPVDAGLVNENDSVILHDHENELIMLRKFSRNQFWKYKPVNPVKRYEICRVYRRHQKSRKIVEHTQAEFDIINCSSRGHAEIEIMMVVDDCFSAFAHRFKQAKLLLAHTDVYDAILTAFDVAPDCSVVYNSLDTYYNSGQNQSSCLLLSVKSAFQTYNISSSQLDTLMSYLQTGTYEMIIKVLEDLIKIFTAKQTQSQKINVLTKGINACIGIHSLVNFFQYDSSKKHSSTLYFMPLMPNRKKLFRGFHFLCSYLNPNSSTEEFFARAHDFSDPGAITENRFNYGLTLAISNLFSQSTDSCGCSKVECILTTELLVPQTSSSFSRLLNAELLSAARELRQKSIACDILYGECKPNWVQESVDYCNSNRIPVLVILKETDIKKAFQIAIQDSDYDFSDVTGEISSLTKLLNKKLERKSGKSERKSDVGRYQDVSPVVFDYNVNVKNLMSKGTLTSRKTIFLRSQLKTAFYPHRPVR